MEVIIQVHNRHVMTVRCLELLASVVLLGDGLSEGTSEAIQEESPTAMFLKAIDSD